MANGDAAELAGMDVVASTDDRRLGYDEINKTRDYIAPLKKDVEAATSSRVPGSLVRRSAGNAIAVDIGGPTSAAPKSYVDEKTWPASAVSSGRFSSERMPTSPLFPGTVGAGGDIHTDRDLHADRDVIAERTVWGTNGRFDGAWGNNITSTRRAVWMQENGTLGHTASSERYKKNVRPWEGLTDEQFAALSVVTFQWRNNIDPSEHTELGMIAERLDELGMEWAIFRDSNGRPDGIHYDRIVLAVIPYVQRLAARLDALESTR